VTFETTDRRRNGSDKSETASLRARRSEANMDDTLDRIYPQVHSGDAADGAEGKKIRDGYLITVYDGWARRKLDVIAKTIGVRNRLDEVAGVGTIGISQSIKEEGLVFILRRIGIGVTGHGRSWWCGVWIGWWVRYNNTNRD